MNFRNRVCQTLHDEHFATIAMMERLEQTLTRYRNGLPDVQDQIVAKLMSDLALGIEGELTRHFAFEEDELFSYLSATGDAALRAHLSEEHAVILSLGRALVKLIGTIRAQGFDAGRWDEFRRLGREFSERLVEHARKEEMGLLPLLDETMEPEAEVQLYGKYAETA
jgi:hemerythrin-like domain-containing protein